jgi:hypothetical protein
LKSLFRPVGLAAAAVALLAVTSCSDGPKLHSVKGSVLYLEQPAEGATVVFQPANSDTNSLMPSGVVGADGKFTLQTHPHGDGAPASEYVVLITWYPSNARELDNPKNKLPERYASHSQSPFRITVKPGTNELEPFRLTN